MWLSPFTPILPLCCFVWPTPHCSPALICRGRHKQTHLTNLFPFLLAFITLAAFNTHPSTALPKHDQQ